MSAAPAAERRGNGLVPRLNLPSIVVFGLAYMAPGVVVSTFGVIAVAAKGAAPTAYLVATVAMALTALSYGKLARSFPQSGSVYTYARKLLDSRVGFLAGWAILLDYFFLPMVAWLIMALYLNVQFPVLPVWAWLVVTIAVTTAINALGIVLADRVNKVLLTLTVLGLVVLVAVCVHHLGGSSAGAGAHALWNPLTSVGAVTAGAALAAYSFLGFDAVSTLSEEVHDARRNVPRGILLTVVIGGAIFFVIALVMQWVHPGATFDDESTAGYAIAISAGGQHFADVLNVMGLLGGLASCVAIQASTSRLMYVMGRDGVLPRRTFGYLSPRFRTPLFNIVLIAVVGLFATKLSLATATSFINFGAFLAFAIVNVCVVAMWLRRRHSGEPMGVLGHVVIPVAGAVVCLYLMSRLSHTAVFLGLSWFVAGLAYLAVLTRGFRQDPPELSIDAPSGDPVPATS
ncbi:APC family permease [Mycolicibacterium fluoranthenivorans]|uniref:Amino acid transporter n=1 Tax=Mycolicibacterium fluoranthenivorans TaxID=258505 RepID=A0A1G4WYR7_9MYCO|nr:APC family permease [Mycolicibacterium fluoranthenivorans]SCX32363.1 Amino acid transporter [Mycolicibacterium fluoranthenivorans]